MSTSIEKIGNPKKKETFTSLDNMYLHSAKMAQLLIVSLLRKPVDHQRGIIVLIIEFIQAISDRTESIGLAQVAVLSLLFYRRQNPYELWDFLELLPLIL